MPNNGTKKNVANKNLLPQNTRTTEKKMDQKMWSNKCCAHLTTPIFLCELWRNSIHSQCHTHPSLVHYCWSVIAVCRAIKLRYMPHIHFKWYRLVSLLCCFIQFGVVAICSASSSSIVYSDKQGRDNTDTLSLRMDRAHEPNQANSSIFVMNLFWIVSLWSNFNLYATDKKHSNLRIHTQTTTIDTQLTSADIQMPSHSQFTAADAFFPCSVPFHCIPFSNVIFCHFSFTPCQSLLKLLFLFDLK